MFADIVYLKDGKVYEFASIKDASARGVTFETRSGEKLTILAQDLLRLRYGQDEVEIVSIYTKDGILIDGFLIDQDTKTVLIRKNKDAMDEETIQKTNIQQMSKNKIVVLYPELNVRSGIFYPLNSEGANLGVGFAALLGFHIRPPFLPLSKIGIEAGYVNIPSQTYEGMLMHLIPLVIDFQYAFKLNAGSSVDFNFTPRVGLGGSYIIFVDGEGGELQTLLPTVTAGVGMYLTVIPRKFYINIFTDYLLMLEDKNLLHSIMGTVAAQLRF